MHFEVSAAKSAKPEVEFGEAPVHCDCPSCGRNILTTTEQKFGWFSACLLVTLIAVLGIFGFCVYPLISNVAKDTLHRCHYCGYSIAVHKRVRFPSVSKDVITLSCGKCALVLSRSYVVGFALCTAVILAAASIRWYILVWGLPDPPEGPHISDTWTEFVSKCGGRTALGNPLYAKRVFDEEYFGKTVEWDGRLLAAEPGFLSTNFLFLYMSPHVAGGAFDSDVAVSYNGAAFDDLVSHVNVGDEVIFNATLISLGKRRSPHLGILRGLQKGRSNDELPSMHEPEGAIAAYIGKPPISHVPHVARKIGEKRREFINSQVGSNVGFFMGGDAIGG